MSKEYFFKTTKGAVDWSALPRWFMAGDKVTKFVGHTYGLDRDDMMYLGVETIPCTCVGYEEGFFTVPVEYLVDKEGNQPQGDYVRIKAKK
jgi:hypothetical protein